MLTRNKIAQASVVPTVDNSVWVSATKTRNSVLGDTVLDLFTTTLLEKCPNPVETSEREPSLSFTSFIMNQGIKFEEGVYALLKKEYASNFYVVRNKYSPTTNSNSSDPAKSKAALKTLQLLKRQVPMIAQGYIRDSESRTFGLPDLLIRGNYLQSFFDLFSADGSAGTTTTSSHLADLDIDQNLYYVVDIKFASLTITTSGLISNIGSVQCFKTQVGIYNRIMGTIQGTTPKYAFILGRRFRGVQKTESIGIGVVDFQKEAGIYTGSEDAVQNYRIIKSLKKSQISIVLSEFYNNLIQLNMSNSYDFPWHAQKKELAILKKDTSLVWQCGKKMHESLNANGIHTWDDPRFLHFVSGHVTTSQYACIKNIVLANLEQTNSKPNNKNKNKFLKTKEELAKNHITTTAQFGTENKLVFYVDFETVSDINDSFELLPKVNSTPSMIYMIGCGYLTSSGTVPEWKHRTFITPKLTDECQECIIEEWVDYMDSITKELGFNENDFIVAHWGNAEVTFLNHAGFSTIQAGIQTVDICKILQTTAFAIKGAFNYRLKDIANALYKLGYTETSWSESGTGGIDGLDAMVVIWNCIRDTCNEEIAVEYPGVNEIIKYNQIDCKVMYEICRFIQSN